MTSVRDIVVIAVVLFAVGLTTYFSVDLGHKVTTQLLLQPSINDTANAQSVINKADDAINVVDYIYLALFLGFFMALIITGWYVGGDAIAAPIYFFVVVLFGFLGVVLQYVWVDVVASPTIAATVVDLPITNFILTYLGYFTVLMGLVGITAMFAKPPESVVKF